MDHLVLLDAATKSGQRGANIDLKIVKVTGVYVKYSGISHAIQTCRAHS